MTVGDDTNDIRQYYDDSVEKEDSRLERHQLEHDMTWRYLDKYLPRRGKILEIGCATGAYTIPLAKRGYQVTAIDFSSQEVELCRQKVKAEKLGEKVSCIVADGRDLSGITDTDYDAALIMGPLYHLMEEEDRKTVLKQVCRRLKNGSLVFSTFISRYGIWGDIIHDIPDYTRLPEESRSIIERGRNTDLAYKKGSFRGYFAASDEILKLHEQTGFGKIALAGIETAGLRDEYYNPVKGKQRELWLDLFFSISTEPSIIGASNHILYVGEKVG
jgi:S-adenosylmethionine-dependent methyltransferase